MQLAARLAQPLARPNRQLADAERLHQAHVETKGQVDQVLRPLLALPRAPGADPNHRKAEEREHQPADAERGERNARARDPGPAR